MRKINVGISVGIQQETESLFTNGIKQNAITLRQLFEKCPNVNKAFFVNFAKKRDLSKSPWKQYEEHILQLDDCFDKIDVIVSVLTFIEDDVVKKFSNKGIAVVCHVMGPEYHQLVELSIFNHKKASISYAKRSNYNAIWISDHLYDANKDFLEIIYGCKSHIGPYVWNPYFLEAKLAEYVKNNNSELIYQTNDRLDKRVSIFEPNINTVKTCLTPIITAEKAFTKYPSSINCVNVFGADIIKNNAQLIEFVKNLDIQKNKKIFFEARYEIIWSLFKHTDIMLAHQQDLALNYIYFDAAWLGFPLVHNAHFIKDLGYYYEGHDAEKAAEQINYIAHNFHNEQQDYINKSKKIISKYLWDNQENIDKYAKLLEEVV